MSPQYDAKMAWRQRNLEAGLCRECSRPRAVKPNGTFYACCAQHTEARRLKRRAERGAAA